MKQIARDHHQVGLLGYDIVDRATEGERHVGHTGDFVIVVNADKIHLTGKKLDEKTYYSHSGYPGGLKSITAGKLMKTKPERVLKMAVEGMLPKTRLGKQMLSKLKVYAGDKHPHAAQLPSEMKF